MGNLSQKNISLNSTVIGHKASSIICFNIDKNDIETKYDDTFIGIGEIEEINCNSIYLLIDTSDKTPIIYVGKASKRSNGYSVIARLVEHKYNNLDPLIYRNKWNRALCFCCKNWDEADIGILERMLIHTIPRKQLYNTITEFGNINEKKIKEYESTIRQIFEYTSALKVNIFVDTKEENESIDKCVKYMNECTINLNSTMNGIDLYTTPVSVINNVLDVLPSEIWNENTTFIDLDIKDGGFLKRIYEKLMENDNEKKAFPNDVERAFHIMNYQLFGLFLDSIELKESVKNLYGSTGNIRKITANMIDAGINVYELYGGRIMNFDVVIGNPPYSDMDKSAALYDKFIDLAIDIAPSYISMITKNNFLVTETLRPTRDNMIRYGLKKIINYPISREVFTGVSPAVAISLLEKGYKGNTDYTEIQKGSIVSSWSTQLSEGDIISSDLHEMSIISKMQDIDSYYKNVVLGLPSKIESNGNYNKVKLPFTMEKVNDDDIKVRFKDRVLYLPVVRHPICEHTDMLMNQYKVLCSYTPTRNKYVLSNIIGAGLNESYTGSFNCLYHSYNPKECNNAATYIMTKFFRFLLYLRCPDGQIRFTKDRFSLIPDQDFSDSSDIDWSRTLQEVDKQLYAKYKLTDEEIKHIESTIEYLENKGNRPLKQNSTSQGMNQTSTMQVAAADYYNKQFN